MASPDHNLLIFWCIDFWKQQWKLTKLCMFLLFQIWGPVVKMFVKSILGTPYHNSAPGPKSRPSCVRWVWGCPLCCAWLFNPMNVGLFLEKHEYQALTTPLARLPRVAGNDRWATIFVGYSCPPNLYFETSGNKRFPASNSCSLHTLCALDFER